jgi:predicted site-specific integrase-resolvase
MYVNTKTARNTLGVCANTLRLWDKAGKIKTIRTPGGKRLYDLSSIGENREKVIYARVSSKNQRDDLQSQIEHIRTRYPDHRIIEDIGSGLNFKRKGFNALLDGIMSGKVSEVVVAHRDRLCRFGFGLIESIASRYGCGIVVLDESSLSPQEELVKDLVSIIHVFSCRIYGLRKYGSQVKKDKDLCKRRRKGK